MAKYVNKESLAMSLMESMKLTKEDAMNAVNCVFQQMSDALAEEGKVEITGFGKFEIFYRKARKGINPVTMEPMDIAGSHVPKFRPSQTLKNKCNKEDRNEKN